MKRKLIKIICLTCGNDVFTYKGKNQKKFCNKSCSAIYNNKNRSRELYKRIGKKSGIKNRGTWENRFGKEKSDIMKINLSKSIIEGYNTGKYMFGKTGMGWIKYNKKQTGKTLEERVGLEKAKKIKKKLSDNNRGKNNPMYGKPSPIGSGNGWSGWYKGWYFRSLLELSYMINIIERFNIKWKSAENKKYQIKYIDYNGIERSHFGDFILNDKYFIEIKPKKLWRTVNNNIINCACRKFCTENNLIFKIIEPTKLSTTELTKLILNNKVKLIERYKKKFEEKYNNSCVD